MAAKKQSKQSDMKSVVAFAIAKLAEARKALEAVNLAQLTADERLRSNGKYRSGEAPVLAKILDAVDANPGTFHALADRDGGVDPEVLETGPAREALARREALAPLLKDLEELATAVSDDVLVSGETVKALTGPAYAIGKANAPVNPKLKKALSAAIDFYASNVRRKK